MYSLLRHTVFEGTYQACLEFMAENGGDLLEKGYHDWELVSKEKAHKKVDELDPPRHARTPSHEVRFKYSPHYPKARPTTADGVAEYQGYEVAGLRWVYVEEVD
ncbi:MAG: hypothetical protein GTO24_08455 [candidate division Zixibacteria bacterium]|nr:hypothetical protein [candidate division Zixibacteria bacterium]